MSTPTWEVYDTEYLIEGAREQVDAMLEKDVKVPKTGHFSILLSFITELASTIVIMINIITHNLGRRLQALENSTMLPSTSIPTASQPSVVAASSQRATNTSRSKRCVKCHARGHDVSECCTVNPSAMRKRVASNSQLVKQAKASRLAPSISAPAPSFFPPQYYPAPVAPPPMHFANLVADATELRRRAAQSAQDRHNKRSTTTSS